MKYGSGIGLSNHHELQVYFATVHAPVANPRTSSRFPPSCDRFPVCGPSGAHAKVSLSTFYSTYSVVLHMRQVFDIIIVGGSFAGIKSAWDLRNKIPRRHRITLISDKPKTIIRASFPQVVFEDLPLEELALDLAKNFKGTGIEFIHDRLVRIDQTGNQIITAEGKHKFDFLVVATGARQAYELLPGSHEYARSICDPSRILETKKAILNFREGDFYSGVGAGYTPTST